MAAADTPLGRLAAQHRADSAGSPLALLAAPNVADALQRFRYLTKAATRRDGDTLAAKERYAGRRSVRGERCSPSAVVTVFPRRPCRRHGSKGDRNLFYGEFSFESFAILLHKVRPRSRDLTRAARHHPLSTTHARPPHRSETSTAVCMAPRPRWSTSAPAWPSSSSPPLFSTPSAAVTASRCAAASLGAGPALAVASLRRR